MPRSKAEYIDGRNMKKQKLYEAVGMILALIGAFVLVGVLMPVINPGFYRINVRKGELPDGYWFFAMPIPILILGVAWYFNRKAQRMQKCAEHSPTGAKK
jgi:hypothetical protein